MAGWLIRRRDCHRGPCFVNGLTGKGQLCRTGFVPYTSSHFGSGGMVPREYKWVAEVDFVYGQRARLGSEGQPRNKTMIET